VTEEVKHIQVGTKYHALYKREATKGIDGFCVEASDDDLLTAMRDAGVMYQEAILKTQTAVGTVKVQVPEIKITPQAGKEA
jgi:hypothetical protein